MSEQAAEHLGHGAVAVDADFGTATDGKVGMWIFLLTDAMSFSGLLLGYGILRGGARDWPNPVNLRSARFSQASWILPRPRPFAISSKRKH